MPAKVGKKPVHYKWDRNTKKSRVRLDSQDVDILPDTSKTVTNPGSKYPNLNSAFPGQDLEQLRNKLVLDKLADSTQKVFDNQLQWWTLFCRARGVEPLWRHNDPSLETENLILDYIVHSGIITGQAPGTVKVRLAVIRSYHLAVDLPDSFLHMPRVAMALAGLKRRRGS